MKMIREVVSGSVGMLFSMSVAAQGPIAPGPPVSVTGALMEPTMIRVFQYPNEMYTSPEVAPVFPYSCYRVGRCTAYDLYRFRDRPNRLTRLAPEAPSENDALPPSNQYVWVFAPITPEENILPKYRTASQVRVEFREVGRLIDGPE